MASSRESSRNGSQEGIRPRYRRAFGCVTWTYMGILVFLAVGAYWVLGRLVGRVVVDVVLAPRLDRRYPLSRHDDGSSRAAG